jgi:low affinity Fe/Cu permease
MSSSGSPPAPRTKSPSLFTRFSRATALTAGRPGTFILAVLVIAVWGITGPLFHYSDTWQLVINTGTTVITFLMVFLIQATQNRDSAALHVKLDELIRAMRGARNGVIDLDQLTDEELARIQKHYQSLAKKSKDELRELQEDPTTVVEATTDKLPPRTKPASRSSPP